MSKETGGWKPTKNTVIKVGIVLGLFHLINKYVLPMVVAKAPTIAQPLSTVWPNV